MSIIQEKKLKEVAKELTGLENITGLEKPKIYPQINYNSWDGDIWIDWMTQGSFRCYHSRAIMEIPLHDIMVMGLESEEYINYEKGLRDAIENQIKH